MRRAERLAPHVERRSALVLRGVEIVLRDTDEAKAITAHRDATAARPEHALATADRLGQSRGRAVEIALLEHDHADRLEAIALELVVASDALDDGPSLRVEL